MEGRLVVDGKGINMYAYPCADCGTNDAYSWRKTESKPIRCNACRTSAGLAWAERIERGPAEDTAYRIARSEHRLRQSLRRIRAQGEIDSEYLPAADKLRKHFSRVGWFQSINEMMAALELVRQGVKARHQVQLGRWKVDFVLPELKVVLEIDGGFHTKKTKPREDMRDACIIAALGGQWEIVRIREHLLRQKLKQLVPAITTIVDERRKLRAKNNGQLPEGYSEAI